MSASIPDDVLVRLNRLELLERLAADVGHEMRNPLHAMIINLDLVRLRISRGPEQDALDRLAVIEEEVHRVHELADGFLRLLRPSEEEEVSCDVDGALAELEPVLRAVARASRVKAELQALGAPLRVALDGVSLKQIILNLFLRSLGGADGAAAVLTVRAERTDAGVALSVAAGPEAGERPGSAADGVGQGDGAQDNAAAVVGEEDGGLGVVRVLAARAGGLVMAAAAAATGAPSVVVALPAVDRS